jgi:predicted transcriptional regulator
MLHLVQISEIKTHAEAVNLSLKALAKAANVTPGSAYKAARGDADMRLNTLKKLIKALEDEELRIARHLLALPHVRAALEADAAGASPPSTALRDCA